MPEGALVASATSVRILTALVVFAVLVGTLSVGAANGEDEYELSLDIDEAKVSIVSGNLSVKVTRDWPRVIFWHELDPFSPHFEVSYPKMYSFNDTDGDRIFDPLEADYTMFLDSNHIEWNITAYEKGFIEERGEYALVGMNATVHAYVVGENETIAVQDWAELSFWVIVSESSVTYNCPGGSYVVNGKTELRMGFSLHVNVCLDSDGLVLEQLLQGGGSTNTFQLIQANSTGGNTTTEVSGLVDERNVEEDYSHEFLETSHAIQVIRIANDEGVAKAFYQWESETEVVDGESVRNATVDSSYYTNGAGMILHSLLAVGNCTTEMSHASSVGIYESGFVGSISDWIKEYMVPFTAICAVIAVASITFLYRRRKARAVRPIDPPGQDEQETS